MKFDLIQCTVRLNIDGQHGNIEVVKAGPDALTVPELLMLHMEHTLGDNEEACAIRNAVKVGEVEMRKEEILGNLRRKYGSPRVDQAFPRGRHLPETLEDIELPPLAMAPAREEPQKKPTAAERKKEMRATLEAAGVDVPKGNLSEADLQALIDEHLGGDAVA